jgi:hypothetical protein
MDRWSLRGFYFQHYLEMYAENQIDLYTGRWAPAWRRSDERWPLMKESFLLRIPFVKFEALHLIGRCALAAAIGSRDHSLLDRVERNARDIEKFKVAWMMPFALALRAGVAAVRGTDAQALDTLERAARGFEKAEINLYANAASWRRGALLGGDEGRRLVAVAEEWMTGQGVKNVPRLVDVLVPGFV